MPIARSYARQSVGRYVQRYGWIEESHAARRKSGDFRYDAHRQCLADAYRQNAWAFLHSVAAINHRAKENRDSPWMTNRGYQIAF